MIPNSSNVCICLCMFSILIFFFFLAETVIMLSNETRERKREISWMAYSYSQRPMNDCILRKFSVVTCFSTSYLALVIVYSSCRYSGSIVLQGMNCYVVLKDWCFATNIDGSFWRDWRGLSLAAAFPFSF